MPEGCPKKKEVPDIVDVRLGPDVGAILERHISSFFAVLRLLTFLTRCQEKEVSMILSECLYTRTTRNVYRLP